MKVRKYRGGKYLSNMNSHCITGHVSMHSQCVSEYRTSVDNVEDGQKQAVLSITGYRSLTRGLTCTASSSSQGPLSFRR